MSGHWERDGEEFYDLDEMWDYIRDNEEYFDEVDFERWLNRNFTAAQIVFDIMGRDTCSAECISLEYMEEFEDAMWAPDVQDKLIEGKDYYYGDCGEFEFKWVEDEDEDEEEE